MREVALTLVGSRTQWLHTCKSLFWKLYIIEQEEKVCWLDAWCSLKQ